MLTVRSLAAIGYITSVIEQLDPPQHDLVRLEAAQALISWLAYDRENDYVLFEILNDKYKSVQADRILRLLHGYGIKDIYRPEIYENLIEYLDNANPIVRELAAFRLYSLVPAGASIPYSAAADSDVRRRAVSFWQSLIPTGSLPAGLKKKAL